MKASHCVIRGVGGATENARALRITVVCRDRNFSSDAIHLEVRPAFRCCVLAKLSDRGVTKRGRSRLGPLALARVPRGSPDRRQEADCLIQAAVWPDQTSNGGQLSTSSKSRSSRRRARRSCSCVHMPQKAGRCWTYTCPRTLSAPSPNRQQITKNPHGLMGRMYESAWPIPRAGVRHADAERRRVGADIYAR